MKAGRYVWSMSGGLLLLGCLAVLSLRLGAVPAPFSVLWEEAVTGEGFILQYRLPRLIIAVLVGINMAVAGAILQAMTKNPLAAPDIVGISAGGGLASVILILLYPGFQPFMLPLVAFGGALVASLIVYSLSYDKGMKPEQLALGGVAVSAGLQALITFFIVKYALDAAQALVWLKGSLYARSWQHVHMLWPWTLAGCTAALVSWRQLNLLLMSEDTVRGLGMRVQLARFLLLITAAGLAASAVAVAGTIGFVGLVIPHAAKLIAGSDSRFYLPLAALMGAILVTTADTIGRIILPPIEVPAGIITALIGAPYFVYLLVRRKVV
ncbi:FecCD family ABC transporter permease [Fictibacillus iocasae]|uniref:FecCD family ABC transporter permease n=1 Tax=Fictibacillus iocasae TaxID=2715437 RepID=A0ABW2NUV2_9BACL